MFVGNSQIFYYLFYNSIYLDYYSFFFYKKFLALNSNSYICFLLNNIMTNFSLFFFLFSFYFFRRNTWIFYIFIIILFKLKKIKLLYNLPFKFYRNEQVVYSLLDGFIQVHPPVFYLFLMLLSTVILFNLKIAKKNFKYISLVLLLFTSFLSITSGGYWSYTQLI